MNFKGLDMKLILELLCKKDGDRKRRTFSKIRETFLCQDSSKYQKKNIYESRIEPTSIMFFLLGVFTSFV